MEALQIFSNPQFGQIRIAMNESNEPAFCLLDLCKSLGLSNNRKVKSQLDEDVTLSYPLETAGGTQQATFVTEAGMYSVILRSDSPKAKPMQKWVTGEVLPAIRKSGGYMLSRQDETPEEIMARALNIAQDTLKRREERITSLEHQTELQSKQLQESAPKVQYVDTVLQSVNTLTATQVAKEIGLEAFKLNQKLKECGVLYKQSGQWLFHAPYSNWGLHSTRTQTFTRSDGSTGTSIYTVYTQKGRRFIHALHNNNWDVKKAIKQIKGELEPAA